MVQATKIVVVGPKNVGKTSILKVLAGNKKTGNITENTYDPTVACRYGSIPSSQIWRKIRIVECEKDFSPIYDNVRVEFWDVSGDMVYEKTWPAIRCKADAVILVYDPEQPGQDQEICKTVEASSE